MHEPNESFNVFALQHSLLLFHTVSGDFASVRPIVGKFRADTRAVYQRIPAHGHRCHKTRWTKQPAPSGGAMSTAGNETFSLRHPYLRARLEANIRRIMAVRAQIESLLRARRLDVTLTTAAPLAGTSRRSASTGLAWLDGQMAGGWPRGESSEIVGPASSGRTAVLCATFAAATARGEIVALVDALDCFDPQSAAAAGIELSQMLWARGESMPRVEVIGRRRPARVAPGVLRIRASDLARLHVRRPARLCALSIAR